MTAVEVIEPRWQGLVIVAAPGPSLTPAVAEACRGHRVLAVGDAWQRLPWAEILYHCDARWWDAHKGCKGFAGERWSTHHKAATPKLEAAAKHGLRLVAGKVGKGWSLDPAMIHFGSNSGFQAIGLAILFGATRIVLVGFDLRGKGHFRGCIHPRELQNRGGDLERFAELFDEAATLLPTGIEVLNATQDSTIRGLKKVELEAALAGM